MKFDLNTFDVDKYDAILSNGLSYGLSNVVGQICIEAAICEVLGLPKGDDPRCVTESVRYFKVALNDKHWSSATERAKGLRDLGLAQLGSLGYITSFNFSERMIKTTIQVIIPKLFRELYPNNPQLLDLVEKCKNYGTLDSIMELKVAANIIAQDANAVAQDAYANADSALYAATYAFKADSALYAAQAADYAYIGASTNAAASSACIAAYASYAVNSDKYLILSAQLALQILKDLNSPGVQLLK